MLEGANFSNGRGSTVKFGNASNVVRSGNRRPKGGEPIGERELPIVPVAGVYAVFSKVNHALVGTPGVSISPSREGVNHPGVSGTGGVRRWIESHMPDMDQPKRVKLSELVGRLYTLRIAADYQPSVEVDGRDAREAISIMNTVFDSF